jgi:hypothetical protein
MQGCAVSKILWEILGNIVAYYLVIYVIPLLGGLVMLFWVKQKENLWRGVIAGLMCFTCLLVVSSILASHYDEVSKIPVPVAYEEIKVPAETAVGLPAATLKNLISRYGDNLSAIVYVKDNIIAYRIDGGIPTATTAQQVMPTGGLYLQSVAAVKNFRAISAGPVGVSTLIAVNYFKGRIR